MKIKKNFGFMIMIVVVALGMAACGVKSDHIKGERLSKYIDCSKIQTDSAMDAFFGGDFPEGMGKIEPLLIPTLSLYVNSEITVFTGGADDDLFLKWQIVLAQISTYGSGEPVACGDGGENYIVTEETIREYFNSSFSGNVSGAPEIAEPYRDMYSGKTGEYTIPAHLDLPRVYAVVENISLSKANSASDAIMSATMDFILTSPLAENPETPFRKMSIEIVQNPQSIYGYSLQSLSMTDLQ